jgi:hypothetical protein
MDDAGTEPDRRRRTLPSLAFDEDLLRTMSSYIVAVNRLRHAQDRVASLDDPTQLRVLAAGEHDAEQACLDALVQRGWQPPFAGLRRGA